MRNRNNKISNKNNKPNQNLVSTNFVLTNFNVYNNISSAYMLVPNTDSSDVMLFTQN